MTGHRAAAVCLVFVVALSAVPRAQEGARAASVTIFGTVEGPDGARLPGALITLLRDESGGEPKRSRGLVTQVVSGEQGVYRATGLLPGRYRVRAELQGFRTVETLFETKDAEGAEVLDLRLGLDALSETVTVVGRADRGTMEPPRIRESAARDVGEAISSLAGVWKVRRGAIANDLVVRGYQGDNVTVLIDGVRLYGACPNNMDHTAFHVDFAEVERIEVGKGPFDLKSQGGLGAAVNIVTRRPAAGFHLNPQLSIGSFGYVNPTVTASYGTQRVAVLGGFSYRVASPYRDGSGRSIVQSANYRPASFEGRAFDVKTGWVRGDGALASGHSARVSYTRQRAGQILYPYLQMDALYDNADRANVGFGLERALGPVKSFSGQFYVTRVEHGMTDADRLSAAGAPAGYSMATRAKTDTVGGRMEAAVPGGSVGIEVYRRGWDASTQLAMANYQPQSSIPGVTMASTGLYAEFGRALGDAWRVDAGARIDRTTNAADARRANTALYRAYYGAHAVAATDVYPSGKLRLAWRVLPRLTLSGGVGRTVRVPDPQERYFGLRRAGTDWVGNPLLRPTRNTGVELAVAYKAGRLFVNANVHRDALADAITVYQASRLFTVPGVVNSAARSYRNVAATMSGVEVEVVIPLTDRLFASGDFSAVRGRQKENPAAGIRSGWMAEMPPPRTRAALRYERRGARRSGFLELETVYSNRQSHVDSDLHEMPTPPYAVTNARVGVTYGPVRSVFGVANLFNRTYVEHLSFQRDPFRSGAKVFEPGRTFYTTLAVVF